MTKAALSVLIFSAGIGGCAHAPSRIQLTSERQTPTIESTSKKPAPLTDLLQLEQEADWVASLQQPSGSILLSTDRSAINPYFSNLAVWALLKTLPNRHEIARKWMNWYLEHLNRPGFSGVPGSIYDFLVSDGREMNLGTCDSFDSYGGTFLMVIAEYWKVTQDRDWVRARIPDILLIIEAMRASVGEHGLTFARPDSRVAYLMDNVEVWRGMEDVSFLLKAFGNEKEAGEAKRFAKQLRQAIELRLWSKPLKRYLAFDGSATPAQSSFYPDGIALIWPIIFDLPEARSRRQFLWNDFKKVWGKRWQDASVDFFSWSLLAYTSVQAGDEVLARNWEKHLLQNPHRNWPWHIGEAAGYLLYLHEKKENE